MYLTIINGENFVYFCLIYNNILGFISNLIRMDLWIPEMVDF